MRFLASLCLMQMNPFLPTFMWLESKVASQAHTLDKPSSSQPHLREVASVNSFLLKLKTFAFTGNAVSQLEVPTSHVKFTVLFVSSESDFHQVLQLIFLAVPPAHCVISFLMALISLVLSAFFSCHIMLFCFKVAVREREF